MRLHRAPLLAAVLVVGLVLTGTLVPAARADSAGPGPSSAAPVPAAATANLTVWTVNSAGVATDDFWSGTTHGPDDVYFFVSDLDTNDRSANLSVSDPFAARDGLTNPVWTGSVGFSSTDRNNTTTASGLHYTIPLALTYGGTWTVTANATFAGNASANFTVGTFYVDSRSNPAEGDAVVPSEPVSIFWGAVATANGATYADLATLTINISYTAGGTLQELFGGSRSLSTAGIGSLAVAVPDNATVGTAFDWTLVGNVTNGSQVTESSLASGVLYVGAVAVGSAELSATLSCAAGNAATSFVAGATVAFCLVAGASFEGSFSPVPSLSVSIAFSSADGSVAPPGDPPSHLVTNATGTVTATFQASVPPFTASNGSPLSRNWVRFVVTDPSDANPTGATAWENSSFVVSPASGHAIVSVALGQAVYYLGETVTANWSVSSTGSGGFSPFAWALLALPDDGLLAEGSLASSPSSGSFTVPLPATYTGGFSVEVEAENATTVAGGNASASMRAPGMLITPSAPYYLPGQQLTFTIATVGGALLPGATLFYDVEAVYASSGAGGTSEGLVVNGSVADGGDVLLTVPSASTPVEYQVVAWAQSPTLGLYASGETTVAEAAGFQVLVGVPTAPQNPDGTYAPGQAIVVSYQVQPYGNLPSARPYTIDLGVLGTLAAASLQTTSTSGNVTLTLPADLPQGSVEIYAEVYGTGLSGPNCYADECEGYTWIPVNPHPAATPAAAPDLGFTEAWFLLLAIVIAVAGVLYVVLRPRSPRPMLPEPLDEFDEADLEPGLEADEEPDEGPDAGTRADGSSDDR
ncbi:MAG TPA: hypothetical protein VMG81_05320 [Thermoplasmata archaeon]|nr:hypothetical protein [Thermoplasmata archaeon]